MLPGLMVIFVSCSRPSQVGNVTVCTTKQSCRQEMNVNDNPGPVTTPTIKPLDQKSALMLLRENCIGCHGIGRDKRSFWPMPAEFELPLKAEVQANQGDPDKIETFESLLNNPQKSEQLVSKMEADQFSVEVFQAIENNLTGADNALPTAMRPTMSENIRKRFVGLLDQIIATSSPADALSKKIGIASTPEALSLSEARSWCSGCHSPGGSGANVWSDANGGVDVWKNFALSARSSVAAGRMPIGKPKGSERSNWLGLAAWFQERMPLVVAEAREKYHGQKLNLGLPVDYKFQCNSKATGRQFINRLTSDALGRPPTPKELALVSNIDQAVTMETRTQLVNRLAAEWKDEFFNYGFKSFADKIAATDRVRTSLVIVDPNLREDIANEFYQLLKSESLAKKSYKDILLSNKVFVTNNTAPLYNETCKKEASQIPTGQKYTPCAMDSDGSPRINFFTTLGFLASKSSSMFIENNNYGRVAAMNEVIRGEPLLANTTGEQGDSTNPIPQCFMSSDWRVLFKDGNAAPRGTLSIPASGNFCQACHIRRNLAAGAIAFRPFGPMGEILNSDVITKVNTTDVSGLSNPQDVVLKGQIAQIFAEKWHIAPPNTDPIPLTITPFYNFLNIGTLPGQERGCIVDPLLAKPKTVTKVADLVEYALSDDMVLARGLARIVPRALSNLNATNPEIIKALTSTWKTSGGQLLPIFQAYFATDTYACSSSGVN